MTKWYAGVPWLDAALTVAEADDAVGPVSEVARSFIAGCEGDPTRTPTPGQPTAVQRGQWVAVVSADLVVVGHGRVPVASPRPEEDDAGRPARGRSRGPKDYGELVEWLGDEGYAVVDGAGGHLAVVRPSDGQLLVTLSRTPSDTRALANDVAECRRTLGVKLRRPHR